MARRVAAGLRLLVVATVLGAATALVTLAGAQAAGIAVLSQGAGGPSSSLRAPGVVFVVGAELIGAALLVGAGAGDRDGGEET